MALKDIKVRLITDDDMVDVTEWYRNRKWKSPPLPGILPETGYVAILDDRPIAAIWLYVTNSKVGILDWIATNPESGASGLISLKKIVDHVVKVTDISVFWNFTSNEKLSKYLRKKCGFKFTERAFNCVLVPTRSEGT